jgi:hypothetical protein
LSDFACFRNWKTCYFVVAQRFTAGISPEDSSVMITLFRTAVKQAPCKSINNQDQASFTEGALVVLMRLSPQSLSLNQ